MKCTYKDCKKDAKHIQTASDGEKWAYLCDGHVKSLDSATDKLDAKAILSEWVKSMGGAKKAASRMMRS